MIKIQSLVGFMLGFWIVFSISTTAYAQSERGRELLDQLPAETFFYAEIQNCSTLFQALQQTELASSLDRFSLPQPVISALHKEKLLESGSLDDEPRLFDELSRIFSGPLVVAAYFEGQARPSDVVWMVETSINTAHPLAEAFSRELLDKSTEYGLEPLNSEEAPNCWRFNKKLSVRKHGDTSDPPTRTIELELNDWLFLHYDDGRLLFSTKLDSMKRLIRKESLVDESRTSLGSSRKYNRVFHYLEPKQANAYGFIDTGKILESVLATSPDSKKLRAVLGDTGILEALAAGWTIELPERDRDWQLDAFLLCGVPRKGIWSALTLKELGELIVPHCPADVGYALVGNSDLRKLIESLDQWKTLAQSEYGIEQNEFMSLLVRYAAPLVLPLMFGEKTSELFDGKFFMFGTQQYTNRFWANRLHVGLSLVPGTETQTEQFMMGFAPPDDPLLRRSENGNHWYVQGDRSYQETMYRIEELDGTGPDSPVHHFGRVAIICENGRLIRFSDESTLSKSIEATSSPQKSLSEDSDFLRVKETLENSRFPGHPSLLLFCRNSELWKAPMWNLCGPENETRKAVWRAELTGAQSTLPQHEPKRDLGKWSAFSRSFKQVWLDRKLDWRDLNDLGAESGPIGGAVWDVDAGFRISAFGLKARK